MIVHNDPWWVNAAWHEAGHAALLRRFGFRIVSVKISGKGSNSQGYTDIARGPIPIEKREGYLIATVAGVESALMAKSKYGSTITIKQIEHGGSSDIRSFNSFRNTDELTLVAARKSARQLLMVNWGSVDLLATKLVRKGSC